MRSSDWKKYAVLFFVCVLLTSGVLILKYVKDSMDTSWVTFRHRKYTFHNQQIDKNSTYPSLYNSFEQSKSTGVYVKGMEVYDTHALNSKNISTVIFLKTRDGRFLIYSLVGGP